MLVKLTFSFLAKGREHKIYLNLKLYIALTKFLLVFTNMSYFIAQFIKKLLYRRRLWTINKLAQGCYVQ